MKYESVSSLRWNLPLVSEFRVAQRTAKTAGTVLITLTTGRGEYIGHGASVPVAYVTGETVDSVELTVARASDALAGVDPNDLGLALNTAATLCSGQPAALAGLEMAIYDLWGRINGIVLHDYFGGGRKSVATDMTVSITGPDEAERLAAEFCAQGFKCLKVKVGDPAGVKADLARISAVLRGAPGTRVKLDGNQGLTVAAAKELISRLAAQNLAIDLLEQPVHRDDLQGLRDVRDFSPYPLYADESACTVDQVKQLIQSQAVDGIVVKLMKSGISGAIEIMKLCQDSSVPVMVGCMLETAFGIGAALAISAGSPSVQYFDLDSHRLLAPVPGLTAPFDCVRDQLIWRSNRTGWGTELTLLQDHAENGNNL